jgi:hypothetical protein
MFRKSPVTSLENNYIVFQAANLGINAAIYRSLAKKQIDYILGDAGRSYVWQ